MKRSYIVAAALLGLGALLSVASCVSLQSQEGITVVQEQNLDGTWSVFEIAGKPLPDRAEVTLTFAGTAVSGSSGCNSYTTTATRTGDDLRFGVAAMTRRACVPALMEVESRFSTALPTVTRYQLAEDGTLSLLAGDTAVMRALKD